MPRNIRMTVAYDGTDFCGWQIQKNGRTVQGVVEAALERMHSHPVRVSVAGRTDTGVHANGQVMNFRTDIDTIPAGTYHAALNSYLPPDVRCLDSAEAMPEFHSRYDARVRVYRYQLIAGRVVHPMHGKYCWRLKKQPDLAKLNRMASVIVGTHDFTTFAVSGDASPSRIKDIYSASFYPEAPFVVFTIAGRSFLWHMVRSLVGTMVELESRGADASEMRKLLEARDRSFAGVTAPACGLFLQKVVYDGESRGCEF